MQNRQNGDPKYINIVKINFVLMNHAQAPIGVHFNSSNC